MNNSSSPSLECPIPGPQDDALLMNLSLIMEGIIQLVICVLGMIGNLFSIFLLSRKELKNSFNQLLASLSTFDFIYLFTMALEALRRCGLESILHLYLFPYVLHPLNSIALTASIYMTMAIAIERYIAVYHPLDYNRVMMDATTHSRRLAGYLIPVCLVAILFNIPKFLESRIVFIGENIHLDITELRTSELYVTYYHNWARLMVLGVVPVLVISFLNFKIYTAVRSRRGGRKRHDEHLSTVLMMIVLIFIICNLPSLMLNMHELSVMDQVHKCRTTSLMGFPIWSLILGFCSQVLLCVNSSANLFIYSCVGGQFRQIMCKYLSCGKADFCKCPQRTEENGVCKGCKKRIQITNLSPEERNGDAKRVQQENLELEAIAKPLQVVVSVEARGDNQHENIIINGDPDKINYA